VTSSCIAIMSHYSDFVQHDTKKLPSGTSA
jgi:hypothetical protein